MEITNPWITITQFIQYIIQLDNMHQQSPEWNTILCKLCKFNWMDNWNQNLDRADQQWNRLWNLLMDHFRAAFLAHCDSTKVNNITQEKEEIV